MPKYLDLSQSQLEKLALALSASLKKKAVFIGFRGPLGSGKTTFIKALARGFGIKKIKSPTFVISHEYKIHQGKFYHLDFYRLNKLNELAMIGLTEMLKHKNVVLAEWIDRFPQLAKRCDIIINIKIKKNHKRDVEIKAS